MGKFEKKDSGLFQGDIGFAVPIEFKADDTSGCFEGYGAVFGNEDRGGDTIVRGAFAASLATRNLKRVKLLYQHDSSEVLGHFTEIREDEKGLFVKGQLALDVQKAREVHALMKCGALDSMSIGYRTVRSERDDDDYTRKLLEVELWEVSIVTFAMNESALISNTKAAPNNERDLETFLRDAGGFSRTQAKALVAEGFKAVKGLRDAGDNGDSGADLLAALRSARSAITG